MLHNNNNTFQKILSVWIVHVWNFAVLYNNVTSIVICKSKIFKYSQIYLGKLKNICLTKKIHSFIAYYLVTGPRPVTWTITSTLFYCIHPILFLYMNPLPWYHQQLSSSFFTPPLPFYFPFYCNSILTYVPSNWLSFP